jgi:DNA-binding MarR family transcriptional regulator
MTAPPEAVDGMTLGRNAELLRSLWLLNHALEQVSCAMEAAVGVTSQQRTLIRCIGKFPSMTAGQLARLFHLDAATVSTLQRLEKKGLVQRRRDPRDRRRASLGLTALGREIDALPLGPVERAAERLLTECDPGDVARTRRVIETFAALVRAESSADIDATTPRMGPRRHHG